MLKNPEINLHIYGQLNFDKSANVIPQRKESLSTNGLEQFGICMEEGKK